MTTTVASGHASGTIGGAGWLWIRGGVPDSTLHPNRPTKLTIKVPP